MKTLVLILCILAGNAGWALADDPAMAATMAVTVHTIMGGTVKSVSWADPDKGTKSEIVVLDPSRKKINILVTPNTTLWDADAQAVMADQITPRKHVNVIYLTTPEGIDIAKSIKILK